VKEELKGYAFHIHGDYSPEWIKCIEVIKKEEKYLARTTLLPNCKFFR